jgi:uncharacterized membrane protein
VHIQNFKENAVNLREKILILENRIIDWLTILTWWIEVRFGKTNVDLAVVLYFLAFCGLFFAFGYAGARLYQLNYTFFSIIFFLIALIILIGTLGFVHKLVSTTQRICKDFPQGCPSPSRYLKKCSQQRFGATLTVMLLTVVFSFSGIIFFYVLAVVALVLNVFYFLLSCDSIPPEEKARRRAKNEMKNLAVQSTGA